MTFSEFTLKMKLISGSVNPVRKFIHKSLDKSGLSGCRIISNGVNATIKIGRKIARQLKAGDIVCLFGELGSGKTVLTKGIALGLGIKKNKVISPSFVLIRQYTGAKIPLYHFDLYRLKRPHDVLGLGYEEYLYDEGITVIEWADRLKYLLPKEYLRINLEVISEHKRRIEITDLRTRNGCA